MDQVGILVIAVFLAVIVFIFYLLINSKSKKATKSVSRVLNKDIVLDDVDEDEENFSNYTEKPIMTFPERQDYDYELIYENQNQNYQENTNYDNYQYDDNITEDKIIQNYSNETDLTEEELIEKYTNEYLKLFSQHPEYMEQMNNENTNTVEYSNTNYNTETINNEVEELIEEVTDDNIQIVCNIIINGKNYVFLSNNNIVRLHEKIKIQLGSNIYEGVVAKENYPRDISTFSIRPRELVIIERIS